jgi:hypothetical protein
MPWRASNHGACTLQLMRHRAWKKPDQHEIVPVLTWVKPPASA